MSSSDHQAWKKRIASVQREKMTPAQLHRMKQLADRQKVAMKARAQSYNMQKKSNGLRSKWASGVSALSVNACVPPDAYFARCEAAQTEMLQASSAVTAEEEDEALSEYVALQNLSLSGPAVASAEDTGAQEADLEVQSALQQLKAIPENDQEQETKFKVYETFAERAEHIRKQLFSFVEENKETLGERPAQDFQRRIEKIDSEQNMGVGDDVGEDVWFVYHMAVQVDKNVVMMNGVMADFDRKLALLASQTECPVCFEAFAEGERRAEVLGCCHSVCKECWTHIQQLAPGRALCPMCRYEDFYVALSGGAAAPGADSDED